MMLLEQWSIPDSVIACDASTVGCGGWFTGKFFHCKFPLFIQKLNLHINSLELLVIMVTFKVWGRFLKGKKIVINCDNICSVNVVNSGFSRVAFHQSCLREICFVAALSEFQVKAQHIKGVDNRLPDWLSRWDEKKQYQNLFYDSCKFQNVQECIVPEHLFKFSHDW